MSRSGEVDMAVIRVGVCGIAGRMGSEMARAVAADPGLALTAAVEHPGHASIGQPVAGVRVTSDLAAAARACAVLVDFTAPAATADIARCAAEAGAALLCGATALADSDRAALEDAARSIAVLQASNLSIGVALLTRLARAAARALPEADVEIVEMHHRHKRDAPSGTALALARAVAAGRPDGAPAPEGAVPAGERRGGAIGIHSLRGGEVTGEHEVIFAGAGERVILAHRAESRAAFAAGALRAIRYLAGRPPGCYTMDQVLGEPER